MTRCSSTVRHPYHDSKLIDGTSSVPRLDAHQRYGVRTTTQSSSTVRRPYHDSELIDGTASVPGLDAHRRHGVRTTTRCSSTARRQYRDSMLIDDVHKQPALCTSSLYQSSHVPSSNGCLALQVLTHPHLSTPKPEIPPPQFQGHILQM